MLNIFDYFYKTKILLLCINCKETPGLYLYLLFINIILNFNIFFLHLVFLIIITKIIRLNLDINNNLSFFNCFILYLFVKIIK